MQKIKDERKEEEREEEEGRGGSRGEERERNEGGEREERAKGEERNLFVLSKGVISEVSQHDANTPRYHIHGPKFTRLERT